MIRNAINAISFYIQLAWLKHQREAISRSISKEQRRAKTEDEEAEIWSEREWEIEAAQHAVQAFQEQHYRRVANRKGIPIPEDTSIELNTNQLGSVVMTVDAIYRLKNLIRQDNKEIGDIILRAIPIVISLIALYVSILSYRSKQNQPTPQPPQAVPNATPTPVPTPLPSPTPTVHKSHHFNPTKAGKVDRQRPHQKPA